MTTLALATADAPYNHCTLSGAKSSAQARTGTYSFYCQYNQALTLPIPGGNLTHYGRVAVYHVAYTGGIRFGFSTLSPLLVISAVAATFDDFPAIAYSFGNQWVVVEWKIYFHTTQGYFHFRLDGGPIYEYNDINTLEITTNACILQCVGYSSGAQVYFDDIIVDDSDWPGRGGLVVRPASGNGTYTDWTGDYSSENITTDADTAGTKESFTKDALPTTVSVVRSVNVLYDAAITGSGGGKVTPFIRSNGVDDDGDSTRFDITTKTGVASWNTDPGNGNAAWTRTTVDACEIGVKSA